MAEATIALCHLGFELDDDFFESFRETAARLSGDRLGSGLPSPVCGFLEEDPEHPGCWVWSGSKDKDGYGSVRWKGKTYRAHRLTFMLANPDVRIHRLVLMHECDNPKCVRPDHLVPGTQAENVADMIEKGRAAWQE